MFTSCSLLGTSGVALPRPGPTPGPTVPSAETGHPNAATTHPADTHPPRPHGSYRGPEAGLTARYIVPRLRGGPAPAVRNPATVAIYETHAGRSGRSDR